jgi:hypothetical protein
MARVGAVVFAQELSHTHNHRTTVRETIYCGLPVTNAAVTNACILACYTLDLATYKGGVHWPL